MDFGFLYGIFGKSNEVENVKIGRFLREEIHFENGRRLKTEIGNQAGTRRWWVRSRRGPIFLFCFLSFFLSLDGLGNGKEKSLG